MWLIADRDIRRVVGVTVYSFQESGTSRHSETNNHPRLELKLVRDSMDTKARTLDA